MANKLIGYIILIIGAIVVGLSFSQFRAIAGLKSLPFSDIMVMAAGAIVLILGAIMAFGTGSNKQAEEVPIYEGEGKHRRIIGYRKMKVK